MTTPHAGQTTPTTQPNLASGIRESLAHLEAIDRETAGYLKALAFIMYRVAASDHVVSPPEIRRMESILVDHASLSPAEAVLTVEIARHCRELADCALSYDASRKLRSRLDAAERSRLRGFLDSIATADGEILPSEMDAIRQISAELGLFD